MNDSAPPASDRPPVGRTPVDRTSPLLQIGGGMGVAASTLGMLLLIAGCAGLDRALLLAFAVVGLAVPGLVISLIAAWVQRERIVEETHILQALFANVIAIVGGLLELAVALGWKIFYQA